jgi:hypothetical protein
MQKELLGRHVKAWEGLDLNNLMTLLKEDATYPMPPLPQWYLGTKQFGLSSSGPSSLTRIFVSYRSRPIRSPRSLRIRAPAPVLV